MMIDGGGQILHFLRYLLLKITSGLKNSPWYLFLIKKLKNDIKVALKLTGIKLQANPIKIYHAVYICQKRRCGTIAEQNFFNRTLLNTINLIGEKLSSSYFLVHSQSLIEVRQIIRTNFIKLLLSDYTVYGIFVWKALFFNFDRLSIK